MVEKPCFFVYSHSGVITDFLVEPSQVVENGGFANVRVAYDGYAGSLGGFGKCSLGHENQMSSMRIRAASLDRRANRVSSI